MTALPFVDLAAQQARIRERLDAAIARVLDHGQYIMGPEVAELETKLAAFSGVRHCIGVSSGTDALVAPLMALGIGQGDAVFMPAFTFTATAEVVVLLGATPVFVDVDNATFNIDPGSLEAKIDEVRGAGSFVPKALIPVDLFGLPADYRALSALAEAHGLTVIADAAQSFGGALDGERVGRLAPVTATSFFPAKPLGCYGDGGAVLTDDDGIADAVRSIRAHGKGREKYDIDRIGLNARLDTMQASILIEKLAIFEDEIAARQRVADAYTRALRNVVATPKVPHGAQSAWAQYTIRTDGRDELAAALKARGIPTAVYYPRPMHLQSAYAEFGAGPGSLPVSESLCDEVLSLPMHPYLDPETIERIAGAIRDAM